MLNCGVEEIDAPKLMSHEGIWGKSEAEDKRIYHEDRTQNTKKKKKQKKRHKRKNLPVFTNSGTSLGIPLQLLQ